MDPELKKILQKQQYALVGKHSGVKICHWMRQSLLFNRQCYKQSFYGIESHRCLQMTPTINQCTQLCLFCWRFQNFTEHTFKETDDPTFILEQSINAQKKLITGFKGDPRCDQKKWEQANTPTMVACSLSGEPTLYPKLGEFFAACHKKGMTTFLVTNGTQPEALANLDPLPTQLYVSVVAPDEETYKKICAPLIPNGWEKLNQTLELLPSLSTRTVIRHTLVNGWNMDDSDIEKYAKLDEKASPQFIEPKGYVFVGSSRIRMTLANMPKYPMIKHFGEKLAENLGYELAMEKAESLVVLLTKTPKKIKIKSKEQ
ncbi:MAG: 4-demethylwyosine synthase TYW1 [Euryarchaeota archaeon]|nr:4-demethylwyosine synthase TYW1 [Euryarchaeota archaeon]